MPNSTKAIITIASIIMLISGLYLISKSMPPVDRNFVERGSSLNFDSEILASSKSSSLSYWQRDSSLYGIYNHSSQDQVAKVVEIPKIETTSVVDNTQTKTIQPLVDVAKSNFTYEFNKSINQRGVLSLTQSDFDFLNENISDVADYYYNSIKNLYLNQKIYVYSTNIKKLDNSNYLIAFENTTSPQVLEGSTVRSFNPKVYKLSALNNKDGEFEESNLTDLYGYPIISSSNYSNDAATIAPPGYNYTGVHD
jgi:hypothetical protein